ncbi:MAG: hypothetical protein K2Y30_15570 [Flavobacteriaceae bacterium]|uniref:GTP-binding protein n=1 Tax=Flavobacterium kayseriense TaxID=2764714 RepID=A0ABR7J3B9_9FLAO|nr:hypothetical protein [Flavobacterium kayseriense]MBC5839923.1 hypothetical protein [Flavobacterium kayseriense]MBC5847407.1 hypothetical protein [Flavobacterium kayseriense]MBU0940127.1 hypothetical protein [Bacteroidota bacterium]MBX9889341.1 hypothetical protein [Flavobacteriaceae bacterium]
MEVDNEIRLLLRFNKDVPRNTDELLDKFKDYAGRKDDRFKIKISGNHVWLYIIGVHKKYYSPHLHLELETPNTNETHIRGLFGPDPTLWTFFMFLHFIVAGVFLIFLGILYSDFVLKNALTTDFIVLSLMVFIWFLLYFIARQIRHNGNSQMKELENLFETIIAS